MKIDLKIIALFFILLYCISPLSSADLQHDDKLTPDNNEYDIKNATDIEIKDNAAENNDLQVENPDNADNITKKESLNLSMELMDTMEGHSGVIRIFTDERYSGPITVILHGVYHGEVITYQVDVHNGYGKLATGTQIPVDAYVFRAIFDGDDLFYPTATFGNFECYKKPAQPESSTSTI